MCVFFLFLDISIITYVSMLPGNCLSRLKGSSTAIFWQTSLKWLLLVFAFTWDLLNTMKKKLANSNFFIKKNWERKGVIVLSSRISVFLVIVHISNVCSLYIWSTQRKDGAETFMRPLWSHINLSNTSRQS